MESDDLKRAIGWDPNACRRPAHLDVPCDLGLLSSFERELGVTFPDDYQSFLKLSNGGVPPHPYAAIDSFPASLFRVKFLGIGPDYGFNPDAAREEASWLPERVFLIGSLASPSDLLNGPTYLVMSKLSGQILAVDLVTTDLEKFHASLSCEGVYKLGESFSEFARTLVDTEPGPVSASSILDVKIQEFSREFYREGKKIRSGRSEDREREGTETKAFSKNIRLFSADFADKLAISVGRKLKNVGDLEKPYSPKLPTDYGIIVGIGFSGSDHFSCNLGDEIAVGEYRLKLDDVDEEEAKFLVRVVE